MIYFDNSSSNNFKPLCVRFALWKYSNKFNSVNAGRSGHYLSTNLGLKIHKTRQYFSDYFNCDKNKVIFTSGCTEALNLALIGTKKANGHIIATCYEHNSVLRTLEYLKNNFNIDYTIIYPKKNEFSINVNEIENAIKNETYLIVTNHTSNVTGEICDIETVGQLAKKHSLLYLVDGAQSCGHIKVDMKKYNVNMYTIAGHKGLYTPCGIGALLINGDFDIDPIKFGGTGIESNSLIQSRIFPENFEAGTSNHAYIICMQKGLLYTYKHFDKINNKIKDLSSYLIENLSRLKNISIYGNKNNKTGVVSINVKGFTSSEIASFLSENYKICVRSGFQCAPLIHKFLKTEKDGTVRISLNFKNNKHQINKLIKILEKIKK